jgi:DNA invertase Pin-like site-specific DNA recombinase
MPSRRNLEREKERMRMGNEMKVVSIYGRVSTKNRQEVDNQLLQLRDYCQKNGYTIYKEYVDHESGGNPQRQAFKELFVDAHQRKFDICLFWALDRFSREGAKETINYLSELESYGVNFISFTEPYLNSIGIFKDAIIAILGTLARQEKVRLKERVRAGLETARKKGVKLGRRPLPPVIREKIITAHIANPDLSITKLSKATNQTPATIYKTLQNFRAGRLDKQGFEKSSLAIY